MHDGGSAFLPGPRKGALSTVTCWFHWRDRRRTVGDVPAAGVGGGELRLAAGEFDRPSTVFPAANGTAPLWGCFDSDNGTIPGVQKQRFRERLTITSGWNRMRPREQQV